MKIFKMKIQTENLANKNYIKIKMKNDMIIDKIDIGKEFDFNKYNYIYILNDDDFIIHFMKKFETINNI